MKHFILSMVLLFSCLIAFNQITILSDDLLDVGDSVVLANADTVPSGFDPGPPGANLHWDFSGIVMDTTSQLNFLDPATTPYAASFPNSNVAVEGIVDGLGLEGWAYGTKNLSFFQIDGAGGSYDIFDDIVVPFDPPEIMFDFPMNYLDSLDQTTTIDLRLDSPDPAADSIRIKVVTSVESRIDAWGELTTPVWTGEVLRRRDVRVTTDSSWVKLFFFWLFLETNTNTSVTYMYMANDLGYPALQFNSNIEGTEYSMVTYLLNAGVGEAELPALSQLAFDVFPNPAHDIIYCKLNDSFEGQLIIYSMTGKQMNQQAVTINQQKFKLNVSDYPAGMYQMVLIANGGDVSAKKFVVY